MLDFFVRVCMCDFVFAYLCILLSTCLKVTELEKSQVPLDIVLDDLLTYSHAHVRGDCLCQTSPVKCVLSVKDGSSRVL